MIPAGEVRESEAAPPSPTPAERHRQGTPLAMLALGALGVVYGDIGTSPLYALKECFHPHLGLEPGARDVLGVLSLFFWSLTLVIVVKYLSFIMRADNRGEGGIMALLIRAELYTEAQRRVLEGYYILPLYDQQNHFLTRGVTDVTTLGTVSTPTFVNARLTAS